MELSIVIPVYNEASNIDDLYQRIKNAVSELGVPYEILFINDGSKDNSLKIIKELSDNDIKVKYISFSRNFGHQIAITAGIDQATGQSILIMDGDLQDPPELIKDLFLKKKEGFQVVYAKRKNRKGESAGKKMTAKFFYRILKKITPVQIPVDTGDFRIIDQCIAETLRKMPEQQKFLRGQISWAGYKQSYIEYDRDERLGGKSGYSYRKMIGFALDGITSFSNIPLKMVTIFGFFVSFIAFFLTIYALYSRFISKNYVPGWTSLMLTVLFLGGIQLLSLGIIGEYLSRMSDNIRSRPLYIIEEKKI